MSKGIFITGTGTGVGKTHVASYLFSTIERIAKDTKSKTGMDKSILYYKPIQCGAPSDMTTFKKLTGNNKVACSYNLKSKTSPHFAFQKEKIKFDKNVIKKFLADAKKKNRYIFMEGAGGVRTPITPKFDMADLAKLSGFPVLVVAKPGVGTINHTLLTIDYLKSKNIPIEGFIFSWTEGVSYKADYVAENVAIIQSLSKVPFLGAIPKM